MLYSGIDLHKRTCTITTLDARGRLVDEARMATDRLTLASYFSRHRKPHTAVVEATGSWYWLADFLDAEGIALILAHAKYLKAIAYAKVKTDAIDARTLAQLLRAQFIPEAHMISPEALLERLGVELDGRSIAFRWSREEDIDRVLTGVGMGLPAPAERPGCRGRSPTCTTRPTSCFQPCWRRSGSGDRS